MCKPKNKTTKSFQTNLAFCFQNKRLWAGGLQTELREMMGPLQTMFLESALEGGSLEEELEDLFSKENR